MTAKNNPTSGEEEGEGSKKKGDGKKGKKRKIDDGDRSVEGGGQQKKRKKKSSSNSDDDEDEYVATKHDRLTQTICEFVVEKIIKESIPIVLAGVPDNKAQVVTTHLKEFKSRVREALPRLAIPKAVLKIKEVENLAGKNKEVEKMVLQLSKSHRAAEEASKASLRALEEEKDQYNALVERCKRLELRVGVKPHPLLEMVGSLPNGPPLAASLTITPSLPLHLPALQGSIAGSGNTAIVEKVGPAILSLRQRMDDMSYSMGV